MRTENKRKTMVQKKENGVLSVPSELLLTAGIPLDCDLMIETVPGVILIGIEAPVQTVCKPYLKVFDELGIEPMYRLVDGKGRVLIPKSMREAAKLEYGDIVCLGMAGGKITVRKVEVIEVGDQSPEAVEAYVRTAFQFMPDSLRLDLIGELSRLLQKKEG